MSKRVLVIAAHPDDEVIGIGGIVLNHVISGDEVWGVILGEGQTSRYSSQEEAPKELVEELHMDSYDSAKVLGYSKLFFADFPDNRFDSVDLLDVIKYVERIKNEFEPDIIYTHHIGDLNIDHQITARAVITATRPIHGGHIVNEIYAFETLSATEWEFSYGNPFLPNVFVDVTKVFAQKLQAMKCYKSELCEKPHPRSLEIMDASAKKWGSVIGKEYAEALMAVRVIKE